MKIHEKWLNVLIKVLIVLVSAVVLASVGFVLLQVVGKNKLYKHKEGPNQEQMQAFATVAEQQEGYEEPDSEADETQENAEQEEDEWVDGDIRYKGRIYRYNSDLLTFLIMGIDSNDKVKSAGTPTKDFTKGGQSDAMFLAVLNPHTKELSLIAINRDTMTDVDIYDKNGNFLSTQKAQLTLQHGYGDGRELSCERTVKAVSKLFYQLPIHGYCSIQMSAIPVLNDAVGGVELTALETLRHKDFSVKEGEKLHLKGMDAFWYVKYRDTAVFNSAGARLSRQKQYLNAYVAKARKAVQEDMTLPISLYGTLSKYMVTDVTIDEVSYLATTVLDYSFDEEHLHSLAGETVQTGEFEEFHADDKALYELILQIFYETVN